MKTYEVFTEKYSKIYQADGIESVIRKHHKVSNDEIVAVTIADRPDLLSKIEQLEPEREYIQVDARDEHPKESGWYITSISGAKRCWFFAGHWYSIENPTRDNLVFPKWWLKKLTQPPQQPSEDAQQRYEKAVKLLSSKRYPLLGITEVLKIAAGLRN